MRRYPDERAMSQVIPQRIARYAPNVNVSGGSARRDLKSLCSEQKRTHQHRLNYLNKDLIDEDRDREEKKEGSWRRNKPEASRKRRERQQQTYDHDQNVGRCEWPSTDWRRFGRLGNGALNEDCTPVATRELVQA